MEIVLNIERRDRTVVVQLRHTLHTGDADAIGTAGRFLIIGEVDAAECIKKIAQGCRRDAVKLVNDDDNALSWQQSREFAKKPSQ